MNGHRASSSRFEASVAPLINPFNQYSLIYLYSCVYINLYARMYTDGTALVKAIRNEQKLIREIEKKKPKERR